MPSRYKLTGDAFAVVALVKGTARATESSIVASQIDHDITGVPYAFSLSIGSATIDPSATYTIQATIVDGDVAFATGHGVPVLTKGNPSKVDITLVYRPDLLKGAVTGQITAVGLAPTSTAYATTVLVDPATGESLGIEVRTVDDGLPVGVLCPATDHRHQPGPGLRRHRRGRATTRRPGAMSLGSRSSPMATQDRRPDRRDAGRRRRAEPSLAPPPTPAPSRRSGRTNRARLGRQRQPAGDHPPDRGHRRRIAAFFIARGRTSTDEPAADRWRPAPRRRPMTAAAAGATDADGRRVDRRRRGRRWPHQRPRRTRPAERPRRDRTAMTTEPVPERGAGRVPRPRHDGCGDGRQPGPCRVHRDRLEPDARARRRARAISASTPADSPADGGHRSRHRRHLCLGHAGRRGRAVRARRRRRRSPPGTLVIDCSTIAPSGSWDFAARLAERGIWLVDAPVSGGSEGAKNATLTIFVGGDAADVERARPVLAAHRPDDHPRRSDRRRPGGQGRQPGHPGRHLPRRRRGHRPGHQGRPGRRAGRRRARRGSGPELGAGEPQRPDDRRRLPARVQGRAPSQGPRHRPRPRRAGRRGPARSARWPPSSRPAWSRVATATTTSRPSPVPSGPCPPSTDEHATPAGHRDLLRNRRRLRVDCRFRVAGIVIDTRRRHVRARDDRSDSRRRDRHARPTPSPLGPPMVDIDSAGASLLHEGGRPDWLALAGGSAWGAGVDGIQQMDGTTGADKALIPVVSICTAMDAGFGQPVGRRLRPRVRR